MDRLLKKNLVYNFLGNVIKVICPFFAFSYASHCLQAEGIGQIEFSNSVNAFFVLFANLGISTYGVREAAKVRDDRTKLETFCSEVFIINAIAALLSFICFCIMTLTFDTFAAYKILMLIYSIQILAAPFNFEWLCGALEDYGYITARGIAIQLFSLLATIFAIKQPGDEWKYVAIAVASTVLTACFNTYHIKKYVAFRLTGLNLTRHRTGMLILFARALSVSIYANLDSTMLGLIVGDVSVGKYSVAVKLNKAVIPLITALGAVFIPRLSFLAEKNDRRTFEDILGKMFQICLLFAVPIAIGMAVLSDEIVLMIAGESFASAGLTMSIIAPVIVLIPFTTVINDQVLVPLRLDSKVLTSTILGAVVNVAANSVLIPLFEENGAAIATVFAETTVLIVCIINAYKYIPWLRVIKNTLMFAAAGVIMAVSIIIFKCCVHTDIILMFILSVFIGAAVYFAVLVLFKNELVCGIIKQINVMLRKDRS